ncbi:MAG: hypothetical protein WBP45_01440 [Daejeonella sp.]
MMNKVVKTTIGLMLIGSAVFAQSLADAKKAIDAEQYQKGKSILKALTGSQPSNAENYFYLGNVYLKTDDIDSAKTAYNKGIEVNAKYALNYVGLGAVDIASNNAANAKVNFDKAIELTGKKDHKTSLFIGKIYTKAPKPDAETALTYLEKAKTLNAKDAELFLALGDAYRALVRNSEAYSAYRTAFDLDKTLLRSKIELGVLTKLSRAFPESQEEFNSVLALDPNYGPAYRELAETYYLWANAEPKQYDERINKALEYYEKYMDLTDRSLESRMRHADFLILTKKYKELETEANEMAKIDKVNPRVLRYLGYSSYENANYTGSIQALKDFMAKVEPQRVIGKDYLYLGRAQIKTPGMETEGVTNLKKAIEIDSINVDVMSEAGVALFKAKKYPEAAELFEISIKNPKSKTIAYDNFYLGYSYYFDYATKIASKQEVTKDFLAKADSAFSKVNQLSPNNPDAYLYRARIGKLLDDEQSSKGLMVPFYEKYIEITLARSEAPNDIRTKNLIEAYSNLGAFYSKNDLVKAKSYFTKITELDPANVYAKDALKQLGGGSK